ncbi:RNA methyltransferase [Scenedesmus sp. PABB004]|nr:RNA methyltransferase [Scenedesmus sp. PABB004]
MEPAAALAAVRERLDAEQRASLTPNQLKKLRKKRAKLVAQVEAAGMADGCQPAAKRARCGGDDAREASVAPSPGRPCAADEEPSSSTLSGSHADAGAASGAAQSGEGGAGAAGGAPAQPRGGKRRKQPGALAGRVRPLQPRGRPAADPRAAAQQQGSDLSGVVLALQQPPPAAREPGPGPAEQAAPGLAAAAPSAPAGSRDCSCDSRGAGAMPPPAAAGARGGPCRADLSGALVALAGLSSASTDAGVSSSSVALLPPPGGAGAGGGAGAAGSGPADAERGPGAAQRRKRRYVWGNYHKYYGYRLAPHTLDDPRLQACPRGGAGGGRGAAAPAGAAAAAPPARCGAQPAGHPRAQVLDPAWFKGADVLDVGCNEGFVTLSLAMGFGTRSIVGVDIDPVLVAKACANLARCRTELTAELRAAAAARDACQPAHSFGRRPGAPLELVAGDCHEPQERQQQAPAQQAAPQQQQLSQQQPQQEQQQEQQERQHEGQQQAPPAAQQRGDWRALHARTVELAASSRALAHASFEHGNWLELPSRSDRYEVVTCFSVTKWVHLNWGDDGLMRLFHKFFRVLAPGGLLVLEPQPWKSYRAAVHKHGNALAPFVRLDALKLHPDGFADFLTRRVGFELLVELSVLSQAPGVDAAPAQGFDRPILLVPAGVKLTQAVSVRTTSQPAALAAPAARDRTARKPFSLPARARRAAGPAARGGGNGRSAEPLRPALGASAAMGAASQAKLAARLERLRQQAGEAVAGLLTLRVVCLVLAALLLWGSGSFVRSSACSGGAAGAAGAAAAAAGGERLPGFSVDAVGGGGAGRRVHADVPGYAPPYAFPRLIHQTVEDRASMSCQVRESVQTWVDQNPGYVHRLYDAADREAFVAEHFPQLLDLYRALPTNVERADTWRYLALSRLGGVYADSDVKCMQPIDTWNADHGHDAALLVGIAKRTAWGIVQEFNQFVIAAMPGHPVLGAMPLTIAANVAAAFLRGRGVSASGLGHDSGVLARTGPGAFTEALRQYAARVGARWPLNSTRADELGGIRFGSVRAMPKFVLGMGWETIDFNMTCDQVKARVRPEAYICHQFFGTWKQQPEIAVNLTYSDCGGGGVGGLASSSGGGGGDGGGLLSSGGALIAAPVARQMATPAAGWSAAPPPDGPAALARREQQQQAQQPARAAAGAAGGGHVGAAVDQTDLERPPLPVGPGGVSRAAVAQVAVVYASLVAHILVTAFTDPLQTTEALTHILLLGLQLFLLLSIVLAFFLLSTSLSPWVKLGMWDRYLRQHAALYALAALALALVGGVGALRLALVWRQVPYLDYWRQPGFAAVWYAQRACLLLLHCRAAHATATAFAPPKQGWLGAPALAGLAGGARALRL